MVRGTVVVQFLKSVPHFGSSTRNDYYFSCSVNGDSLQWRVNNADAGSHIVQDVIGVTRYRSDNSSEYLEFLTMLLSKNTSNNGNELTAVLVISSSSMMTLIIVCRGEAEQHSVENSVTSTAYSKEIKANVDFEYVFYSDDIITERISKYITFFFVCRVGGQSLTWLLQGRSIAGFVTGNGLGTDVIERHNNNAVVFAEAVLVGKESSENKLTSLLILSEMLSTEEFTITCRSDTTELDFVVTNPITISPNIEETTMGSTSTNVNTVSEDSASSAYSRVVRSFEFDY